MVAIERVTWGREVTGQPVGSGKRLLGIYF